MVRDRLDQRVDRLGPAFELRVFRVHPEGRADLFGVRVEGLTELWRVCLGQPGFRLLLYILRNARPRPSRGVPPDGRRSVPIEGYGWCPWNGFAPGAEGSEGMERGFVVFG